MKETDSRSFVKYFKGFETTCLAFILSKYTLQAKLEVCQAVPLGIFQLGLQSGFRECKKRDMWSQTP